ncbi:receptor protein kinase-like protein ZAR1 [Aegilops tauschii subsp. strangulata]|uniref:Protein kinase domain-containing protein n=1 Tax=Aegilops tauschii subsp. strangulata TaxID=200361 RepID=A0A453RJI8_AEGTS|nr:receptor protein kinase-like protein ZAR1 [Aegilops tauschii subsp. strangulata]
MAAVRVAAVGVLLAAVAVAAAALNTDGLALLALKFAVTDDPGSGLDTWRDADPDPCGWAGVTCVDGGGGRVAGVELANLSLAGYLPSELSLLSELETLSLPSNRLSGQIPVAISALQKLTTLDLAHNFLSGQIPAGIGRLASLSRLDLSSNQLNGTLPPSIAGLPRLSGVLNLSYNHFVGGIPPEFGGIPVAVSLDLRGNDLAGEIPQVGSLVNQGPTAFDDNPRLCGFPLKIECAGESEEPRIPQSNPGMNPGAAAQVGRPPKRRSSPTVPILAVIVVAAIVAGLVLQWQCRRRCAATTRDEEKESSTKEKSAAVTLAGTEERRGGGEEGELFVAVDDGFGMELEELLRASAYVVGKSRGGIVYRVVPGRGTAVAVRRLSEPDDGDGTESGWRRRRAFEAEAAAIGRARHPNVARLRAYYYAPDEKLLIYDYLGNGSLHSALHGGPTASPTPLPWSVRLSIVQGAARGLAYLHECSPRRYVHGCIKSSKILLDDELRPHVSGFGLARLVAGAHKTAQSRKLGSAACALRSGALSALSYVAPELRAPGGTAAAATQKGDVFAFGVVLLEAVTGRQPTEGEGGLELEAWVRRAFKEERPLSEVVDPSLLGEVHAKKQVLAVFHVALGCTEPDPELRPRMRAVAESLDRVN